MSFLLQLLSPMSQITHDTYLKLEAMGKAPISLPAEIYFGGDERLQKSPGAHHLPQYRKTGTWHLPALKEQRKRVAMDRAKRLINMKMSEVELRKVGGLEGVQTALKEHGLGISKDQHEIAELNAKHLSLESEVKRRDRDEAKAKIEKETGKKMESIEAEPINPAEDILKIVQSEALSKVSADDNLSSLENEEDKESNASQKSTSVNLELEPL